LGESRYSVNGTPVAAMAALQLLGIAGYSAPCMDMQERLLPCTTNERTLHAIQLIFLS
jgi:hypothetical protein